MSRIDADSPLIKRRRWKGGSIDVERRMESDGLDESHHRDRSLCVRRLRDSASCAHLLVALHRSLPSAPLLDPSTPAHPPLIAAMSAYPPQPSYGRDDVLMQQFRAIAQRYEISDYFAGKLKQLEGWEIVLILGQLKGHANTADAARTAAGYPYVRSDHHAMHGCCSSFE
jgi:hypothetical protein